MAMLTVRKLPDEVRRALRVRAAQRSHSMAAEVRDILASAVSPNGRVKLGTLLSALGGALEARGIGAAVGGRACPSSLTGPWCASVVRFRGALPQACGPPVGIVRRRPGAVADGHVVGRPPHSAR